MTRARQLGRALGFAALTGSFGVAVVLHLAATRGSRERARVRDRWTHAWARASLWLFGVEMCVHGEANVHRGRGRMVTANHRSVIDIVVVLSQFGGVVLSRADVASWPLLGQAARAVGTVFVDRESKSSGTAAIAQMLDRLAQDDTLCVFPEGTTFTDDRVRPFKPGAFVAARRAHAPVIPVGLVYPLDSGAAYGDETFLAHLARLAATPRARVTVEIGAPIQRRAGESIEQLAARCRDAVQELVQRGRAREDGEGGARQA